MRRSYLVLTLVCGCAAVLLWQARRMVPAPGPAGFGMAFEDCPRCGQRVGLSPGHETRCPGCGERLAACGRCGKLLAGADIAYKDNTGELWVCAEHHADEDWEAAQLREFAGPDGMRPPPDTPRAVAARAWYERLVRDVYAARREPQDALFTKNEEVGKEARATLPPAVAEAHQFYWRALVERDIGSVHVYRPVIAGAAGYVVRGTTDGSDGFLELFDADGTPLGYARTELECPVWVPKGVARRRVFVGDRDETDAKLTEAVARLRGK